MKFEHQISITSQTGVGSSSLLKVLREKLGNQPYRFVSGGSLMRERAKSLGMTIDEFALYNREHPEEGHDLWCDQMIAHMAESDWMICESRLSHHFMPGAFKVLLECSIGIRARRRHADQPDRAFQEVLSEMKERDKNDNLRYELLYPGCIWSPKKFDLRLNTEGTLPSKLADYLLEEHEKWVRKHLETAIG